MNLLKKMDQKEFNSKIFHEHWKLESERLSHRADFFLIFDVILIEAFLHTLDKYSLACSIAVFGLLINGFWAQTGIRTWWLLYDFGHQLRYNKKDFSENMTVAMERMYKTRENELVFPKLLTRPRASTTMGIAIPLINVGLWSGFTIYSGYLYYLTRPYLFWLSIGLVSLIIIFFLILFICKHLLQTPQILKKHIELGEPEAKK